MSKIHVTPIPNAPVEGFGVIVTGVDPGNLSDEDFKEIEKLLYKHSIVLFQNVNLDPEQQYKLTKRFDPNCDDVYGHGNNKTGEQVKSILHPDLKTIPTQPQVQLIGNGIPTEPHITRGLDRPQLKHPHHKTFHKTVISDEDEDKGYTRFYRWHIDAALYNLNPPKITTLHALKVPKGGKQTVRYDDGTNDELQVPLGTTAFVSGRKMFDILPPELKSIAVRSKVRYAPHPYVWMTPAKAHSTGLRIECDNLEVPKDKLPSWEESKIKTYPMVWVNPETDELHFQVHPCGVEAIIIDPIKSEDKSIDKDALYPDGATLTDLEEVRGLLYKMQRPAITPKLVYAHDWTEKDLVIFHNRGVLHSVVGAFKSDQVRSFWQCNLASPSVPQGPSPAQVSAYA